MYKRQAVLTGAAALGAAWTGMVGLRSLAGLAGPADLGRAAAE